MIPPWTLVLGYEHAIREFANKLVSQEGYKFGEALKKAMKERDFISPLSLYGKRTADAPPAPPVERAARKEARTAPHVAVRQGPLPDAR